MNPLAFSLAVRDDSSAGDLLRQIADAGFNGVEPTFLLEQGLPCAADPRRSAEKLAALAGAAQLSDSLDARRASILVHVRFAPDPAQRQRAVAAAAAAMEAVQIMGGDVLLVVPGQWNDNQTHAQTWAHALDTARRIAELAERLGIDVALENVPNQFLLSPGEWAAFLDQVASDRVKLYFDAGNVVWLRLGHPQRWIEQLGRRYIRRVHFKDAQAGGQPRYLLEGEVNWPAVSAALQRIDYTDWIGVELDLPKHHIAAMLKSTCVAAKSILQS